MTFNANVDFGHILLLAGFLFGGISFAFMIRGRLIMVETQLKDLKDVMTTLARQDERMNSLSSRIEDLRHGRGFILNDTMFHAPKVEKD